jgi:hypothetical protein
MTSSDAVRHAITPSAEGGCRDYRIVLRRAREAGKGHRERGEKHSGIGILTCQMDGPMKRDDGAGSAEGES